MNHSNRFRQVPILKKVTEDIQLLSFPYVFGMEQVNCFLFRGEKGFTVVDTGSYSEEGKQTWKHLMGLGMTIEKIILTHFHIDHLGLARWFQEKHKIPIYISNLGYREIQRRQDKESTQFVVNMFKQHGCDEVSEMATTDYSSVYNFVPDGLFEEGEQIQLGSQLYETIWTPGHSSDHFCFYQPDQQIMVIGDHVLEKISPVVLLESPVDVNPLQDYFDSLEKIKSYPVELTLPGHGNLMKGIDKRVAEIKSGHDYRINQMLELLKNGEKSAWHICQETYRRKQFFAPLMATITRCVYLESIGKIKSRIVDNIVYYHVVS
ncbi:MBL fold metallo-hydrolase [Niallia sp. Krafla_26]|uniref:MBL fold metallo-hydrolase n=1 Tax=Niallia sp. Krafla_26 TaxID=3064703 RepID=UPI003D162FF3